MATRSNPKLIGAFVIGGVLLFVVMILAFGSIKLFAVRIPIVMYFEGDLSGLDVGAAVNFRGVRIGSVTNVVLQLNVTDLSAHIPVYAEIEPDHFTVVGGPQAPLLRPGENIPKFVERGLRARLASQSLLTGKLVVELNFEPDTPVQLVGAERGYWEIPTIPSAMAELQKGVTNVVNMLASAKLPELVGDLRSLIDDLDQQVKAANAAEMIQDARNLIVSLEQNVDELTKSLVQTSSSADTALKSGDRMFQDADRTIVAVRPLLTNLENTAKRADELIAAAKDTIEPGSPLQRELITALREIAATARSARALADNLEKNPDSILFGKTGTRK